MINFLRCSFSTGSSSIKSSIDELPVEKLHPTVQAYNWPQLQLNYSSTTAQLHSCKTTSTQTSTWPQPQLNTAVKRRQNRPQLASTQAKHTLQTP